MEKAMIKSPLSKATVAVGAGLLTKLVEDKPDTNVFISPTSIALALAMVQNGAAGETAAAVGRVLGLDGVALDELNAASKQLLGELSKLDLETAEEAQFGRLVQPDEYRVLMKVANGLWGHKGVQILPEFSERLQASYEAEAAAVDLLDPNEIEKINNWVSERTAGKIKQIVQPFTSPPIAVLINAVYFKGGWRDKFEVRDTKEGDFYLADGSTKKLPLMQLNVHRPYYENERMQVTALPFIGARRHAAKGISVILVLPKPDQNLSEIAVSLNTEWWASLDRTLFNGREEEVNLFLPRFKVEYDTELSQTLTDLGMGVAFKETADFSGLSSTPAWIDKVQHKTFLLVNEEGCEAAGATAVQFATFGIMPEPIQMRVDRPFLFAIVTHPGPTLLFVGAINDPEAVEA
jgi:serine protease inhibitor